jgi:hypothetical protein
MTPTLKLCTDVILYDSNLTLGLRVLISILVIQSLFRDIEYYFYLTIKAMAIVVDRLDQKNRPPPVMDRIQGKERPKPPPPKTLELSLITRDHNADLINQSNESFFGSFFKGKVQKGMAQVPNVLKASGTLSEREQIETDVISKFLIIIELLLLSYFNIVKRTSADMIPKIIMSNLVIYTRDQIQRELLAELYNNDQFESGLKESEIVIARRMECKTMITALEKAELIISSV